MKLLFFQLLRPETLDLVITPLFISYFTSHLVNPAYSTLRIYPAAVPCHLSRPLPPLVWIITEPLTRLPSSSCPWHSREETKQQPEILDVVPWSTEYTSALLWERKPKLLWWRQGPLWLGPCHLLLFSSLTHFSPPLILLQPRESAFCSPHALRPLHLLSLLPVSDSSLPHLFQGFQMPPSSPRPSWSFYLKFLP